MANSKKLEEICSFMQNNRQRFIAQVSDMTDEQLEFRPTAEEWNIRELVHHVAIVAERNGKMFSKFLKEAEAGNVAKDETPDESRMDAMDEILPQIAERKFVAPEPLVPVNAPPLSASLEKLDVDRKRLLDIIERLSPYDLSGLKAPHPFLGDLNAYQWLLTGAGHEARHGAQIKRIKLMPEFP